MEKDTNTSSYPKPISKHEASFRTHKLSFSSTDRKTKRRYPPYRKTEKMESMRTEKTDNSKHFSYYLQRKPSALMKNFSSLMSDSEDLPVLLMETADVLKGVTRASGVNLYMVDQVNEKIKLFANDDGVEKEIKFKIEDGKTIAAYVANNREFVMVDNILIPDSRFLDGVYEKSSTIKSVLCVPVVTPDSDCLAIMELYRDITASPFQKDDLKIVIAVTGWMGAALHQNQQRQMLQKQAELNEYLLDLTKCYFAESMETEHLISSIVSFAKITLGAERGSFFITHREDGELVAELFEEGIGGGFHKKNLKVHFDKNRSIPGIVAETGESINIRDAQKDNRFISEDDTIIDFVTKNILCMPIMGVGGILGVMQVLNKVNGPYFTKQDENLFKTFTVYCALALHYTTLRDHMHKKELMSRSYMRILHHHLRPCPHDIQKYSETWNMVEIPDDFEEFFWYITPEDIQFTVQYIIYMFYIVNGPDNYQHENLIEFILACRDSYRDNLYHNWEHAFNVTHCMFNILTRNEQHFNELEKDALLIACLCHDMDHRGVTSNFLGLTNDILVELYETSPMERHHYKMTTVLLDMYPVLKDCSAEDYKDFLQDIKRAIMATDLGVYFRTRAKLVYAINEFDEFVFENPMHRGLLKEIMMTSSDLSGLCKPFPISRKICDDIYSEFHNQGDMEKELGFTPLSMMDRDKLYNVPEDQVQLLTIVVMPCCELLKMILPNTEDLYTECKNTCDTWKEIIDLRDQKYANPLRFTQNASHSS